MREAVNRLEQLYKRYRWYVNNTLFPFIILIWPLVKVSQGVDVSDSTYSLGNYLFFDSLDGTWILSTWLSNVFGALLVRLPFGNTLLGINIYSALVVSALALLVYYSLRNDFSAIVLFAGEILAINMCWIPTGIMYNYLTYTLFTSAALLIYSGVKKADNRYFVMAGVLLGLNVLVRIPNLAEVMLILPVWYGIYYDNRDRNALHEIIRSTLHCIMGFIIGVVIPLIVMLAIYGMDGIIGMIRGLSNLSSGDDTYTISSMIFATLSAYVRSAKWVALILSVIFAGTLMMAAVKSNNRLRSLAKVLYTLIVAVMIRFMWGRGMFSFRYYEDYTSMFEWGMILLFLSWITAIVVLCSGNYNLLVKTYAAIIIVILIITPLGSNNYTMQNLNNMFLIVPFAIFIIGGWMYRGIHRIRLEGILYGCNYPWMSMVLVLLVIITLQTTLFHFNFVFRDGMDGRPRDTRVESVASLKGMSTNSDNANNLEGISDYIKGSNITEAVYWGDCPGLSYILRIPSAIGTTWPDLDSYSIEEFDEELTSLAMGNNSAVIIMKKQDNPLGSNGQAKLDILLDFIASTKHEIKYENDDYIVYGR